MTDPILELQGAIVARLKSDPGVAQIVGIRIYDSVPANSVLPYVSIGPSDLVQDDADCIDGAEVTMQIDAWSEKPGFPEVRQLSAAVRNALACEDIELTENALVILEHITTRVFRDPDGVTSHAAITFSGIVETP